jgi:hypothetical protein
MKKWQSLWYMGLAQAILFIHASAYEDSGNTEVVCSQYTCVERQIPSPVSSQRAALRRDIKRLECKIARSRNDVKAKDRCCTHLKQYSLKVLEAGSPEQLFAAEKKYRAALRRIVATMKPDRPNAMHRMMAWRAACAKKMAQKPMLTFSRLFPPKQPRLVMPEDQNYDATPLVMDGDTTTGAVPETEEIPHGIPLCKSCRNELFSDATDETMDNGDGEYPSQEDDYADTNEEDCDSCDQDLYEGRREGERDIISLMNQVLEMSAHHNDDSLLLGEMYNSYKNEIAQVTTRDEFQDIQNHYIYTLQKLISDLEACHLKGPQGGKNFLEVLDDKEDA